jgi:hypothetical protein
MKTLPHPKDLDRQCQISLHRWIDLFSEEAKMLDPDHKLSVEWFKMLTQEPADLHLDANGRIWMISNNGIWCPYHFSYGNQLIGYKISSKATN